MKNLFNCLINKKTDSQERRIENEIESCLLVAWHDSLPPQKPRIDEHEQKTLPFSKANQSSFLNERKICSSIWKMINLLNAFPETTLLSVQR